MNVSTIDTSTDTYMMRLKRKLAIAVALGVTLAVVAAVLRFPVLVLLGLSRRGKAAGADLSLRCPQPVSVPTLETRVRRAAATPSPDKRVMKRIARDRVMEVALGVTLVVVAAVLAFFALVVLGLI
jgi:hypothetical protein